MKEKLAITIPIGKPLLEVLTLCYTARRPVMLSGATGVGKSTILAEFARQTKIGFISRDLLLWSPPISSACRS